MQEKVNSTSHTWGGGANNAIGRTPRKVKIKHMF